MRRLRISIFVTTFILICIGVVMVYSASSITTWQQTGESTQLLRRQALFVLVGFLAMFGVMAVDYRKIEKVAKRLFLLSLLPLVVVLLPGVARQAGGAKRWLQLGGFNFQPSELIKVTLVIYLADFITRRAAYLKDFWRGFVPPVAVLGAAVLLILLQPDLGTAIALVVLTFTMLFAAGCRMRHILYSILSALPFLYFLIFSVPYRRARIMTFLNPWLDPKGSGFQIIQSQIALGTGGWWGVGLGKGRQKLFYLPAAHTDFIFSIIGEELGLLGAGSVIFLFAYLIICMARVAWQVRDPFGKMICVGVLTLIAFSSVINIGVSMGALPTKGLPLPFISYGGSSLIFHMVAVGLLLNVSRTEETVL